MLCKLQFILFFPITAFTVNISLVLFLFAASYVSSWAVSQSPDVAEVMVGNPITLKCNNTGFTLPSNPCRSTIWTRVHPRTGELHDVDLSDKNFKESEMTKSCDLTVIGQSQEYSGVYYCWIKMTSIGLFGNGSRVLFTGKLFFGHQSKVKC